MSRRVSQHYNLGKTQAELDFVDVFVNKDLPLFLDPFPLSQRVDRFSRDCHLTVTAYFQEIINCIRNKQDDRALGLLKFLREPNETRLGFSSDKPQGAGIGGMQAGQILKALKGSAAVQTGFISSLAECELMIEGIGVDKISDLTTNVIRRHLVAYTQGQCFLHGIPLEDTTIPPCFNPSTMKWELANTDLPVINGKPLLLVPKSFAKISCLFQHYQYYRGYVLEHMQETAKNGGKHSDLVLTLKNEKMVVYKKDLEAKEPCGKEFLYRFSRDNVDVLEKYRQDLTDKTRKDELSDVDNFDEKAIADALIHSLNSIQKGGAYATAYHNLMKGIIEFIFFPVLDNPIKEKEINEGRKRIDIVMDNAARDGIFWRLHSKMGITCPKVPIECKNYSTEISNPELDQLAGRLSLQTGMFGMLCCRHFEDRAKFIKRCRDSWHAQKQLMIPFDDNTIITFLKTIAEGGRTALDRRIQQLIEEVWH